MVRKIIHIDMDAFYAAVEQRDFPQYRGKPVVVGGSPEQRGVVATCSYEARKFGIRSAMATRTAYRLCPSAVFLRPRFDAYRKVSQQIRQIFYAVTPLVEPLSLDEAYLDVSNCPHYNGSATRIASAIKRRIYKTVHLTASAGVSYNKFLAKIASDHNKPDGLTVITPAEGAAFAGQLKIRRFYGVGSVTEKKMHALGIFSGADLKQQPIETLQQHFGKFSHYLYNAARGVDDRPVRADSVIKSIGKETTFARDLSTRDEMMPILRELVARVFAGRKNKTARTMTLKVRYADFKLITRSHTDPDGYTTQEKMQTTLTELIEKTEIGSRKVRLLGIAISNFLE